MSEFTEKLNSSKLVSNAWDEIDKDQANAGLLIDVIKSEFKDWQPPKKLVVVPQCVDEVIRSLSNGVRGAYDAIYLIKYKVEQYEGTGWRDVYDWIFEKGNSTVFERAFLDGYTVEKKVYILKHIDLSKNDKEKDWYLAKNVTGKLYHSWGEKGREHKGMIEGRYFTQSEIDELHTGSYEQIEVDE